MQKELPLWMTIAGNPDTWIEAGRLGMNVLTHLLGQSIDTVEARIKDYHAALRSVRGGGASRSGSGTPALSRMVGVTSMR